MSNESPPTQATAEASDASRTDQIQVSFSEHSLTMVTFVVGAEPVKKTFLVHKHLASAHSPFFKAAFKSMVAEGTTQTMQLDDIEVETFGVLVHWMYAKEIEGGLGSFTNDEGAADFDFIPLSKVWKLAERALVANLQDSVMKEIIKQRHLASDDSLVKLCNFIFSNGSTSKCKLQRFVTAYLALE